MDPRQLQTHGQMQHSPGPRTRASTSSPTMFVPSDESLGLTLRKLEAVTSNVVKSSLHGSTPNQSLGPKRRTTQTIVGWGLTTSSRLDRLDRQPHASLLQLLRIPRLKRSPNVEPRRLSHCLTTSSVASAGSFLLPLVTRCATRGATRPDQGADLPIKLRLLARLLRPASRGSPVISGLGL